MAESGNKRFYLFKSVFLKMNYTNAAKINVTKNNHKAYIN